MEHNFLVNCLLFISIILLSIVIILSGKQGILGKKITRFCVSISTLEFFVLIFIMSAVIMLLIHFLFLINDLINFKMILLTINDNNQYPVRWWLSGTTLIWGIIGTSVAVYRLIPVTPRLRAVAALTSLAISVPTTVYFHAVENPNSFNQFMYSWLTYRKTGSWPATIILNPDIEKVENLVKEELVKENQGKCVNMSKDMSSFISSDSTGNNDFINNHISSLFDKIKQILIDFVRPVPVEGYLDDLLGQQLFIHFLLIIIVVSLIFLFSVFLFIQILLYNKDYVLKRFNNKFVLFYIKYQILLSKISLFILPVFIMFGLIELFIGLYFIITHPIPYDLLPVDLHFYFKK